jgi:hypothetical protein
MSKKLKLDEIEVETFETADAEAARGTVEGNGLDTADVGTCPGQTAHCTACRPLQCY